MNHKANLDISTLPCSRCHQTIQRVWNRSQYCWSLINSVAYWAEVENNSHQQKHLKYQYLCRACLLEWYTQERADFFATVGKKQRGKFQRYRYAGFFAKNDVVEQ